ncbi:MAG TPA: DUF4136 domain-containing protein [Flavobacteriaceae bacterium]|nr:DUF4136 domain-containing protein [Flavobacteriaceae bacterium]
MKILKMLSLILVLALTSCSTVKVATDYDKEVNFDNYRTYAFYKPGIDKAEISDLDKKRILRAIDAELTEKGLTKTDKPDLLISIFTKENQRVDVYNNNFGYGWYWNPYWYSGYGTSVSRTPEGTLFIDIIDAKTNNLIWQGMGTADLIANNIDKKEARIREIVNKILEKYPPGNSKKK